MIFSTVCLKVLPVLVGGYVAIAQDVGSSEESLTRNLRRDKSPPPPPLVDHLFTYGAPSVAANPAVANPNNKCIPGIRTYTEDVSTCSWWEPWCNTRITNTDFAAQWNIDDFPHVKQSTLVLRYRDNAIVEYYYMECNDSDNVGQYNFQSWPGSNQPAGVLLDNIHNLEEHYERRIREVPLSLRGPLLDYTSVAQCAYNQDLGSVNACLDNYDQGMNGIEGVGPDWQTLAFMDHETDNGMFGVDHDTVYVLKNDSEQDRRKCIISFSGSESRVGDLSAFLLNNAGSTGYCGRYGVHIGTRNELWQITHDSQYQNIIKPALETCHEVTCVGHSLGGALCNVFTLCANNGKEDLDRKDDDGMWDDYNSLVWTKPTM